MQPLGGQSAKKQSKSVPYLIPKSDKFIEGVQNKNQNNDTDEDRKVTMP